MCTAGLIGWDPTSDNTSPPSPAFGLIFEGAVGQPRYRRHLFVTTRYRMIWFMPKTEKIHHACMSLSWRTRWLGQWYSYYGISVWCNVRYCTVSGSMLNNCWCQQKYNISPPRAWRCQINRLYLVATFTFQKSFRFLLHTAQCLLCFSCTEYYVKYRWETASLKQYHTASVRHRHSGIRVSPVPLVTD
jgi:hypothetical protein